jgi:hypothetical protein
VNIKIKPYECFNGLELKKFICEYMEIELDQIILAFLSFKNVEHIIDDNMPINDII